MAATRLQGGAASLLGAVGLITLGSAPADAAPTAPAAPSHTMPGCTGNTFIYDANGQNWTGSYSDNCAHKVSQTCKSSSGAQQQFSDTFVAGGTWNYNFCPPGWKWIPESVVLHIHT